MKESDLTRRCFLALAALPVSDFRGIASGTTRSFWVLKLLRPASLVVRPLGTARLHCASADERWMVEGSESVVITPDSGRVRIFGPAGEPVKCVLEIPDVIRRRYCGTFNICSDGRVIVPVVSMDCETAAGSIVEAELPTSTAPPQALAAQAVVARSMLCARTEPRHRFADFCDTTHCQFLRSPAIPGSRTSHGVLETEGCVLFDHDRVLAARYSAACGGATDAILDGDYQYVSVPCEICREHGIARRGHGWGLCQEGAMGLARRGWSWQAILTKYYPNATIGSRGWYNKNFKLAVSHAGGTRLGTEETIPNNP